MSKDVDASMNELSRHGVNAQEALREPFCSNFVAFSNRLQTCFQKEVLKLLKSVDRVACNAILSLRDDVANCQAIGESA